MEPHVISKREGIQLSYVLPHRVTDTCLYSRKPSNGSTIIVCAHDEGLRVVWYAGRKPKQKTPPQTNGNSIDLTDDEHDNTTPEYENEEPEIDPARPFHNVLHYVDVSFGTAAIKIATPPLSSDRGDDFPQITNTHAIILAACADLSLRLVAVPLEPALGSTTSIQQIAISGVNSHQDLVSDVAVTVTAASVEEDDIQRQRTRSRSRSREPNEVNTSTTPSQEWSFLLASTSATGTGLLLIHQIPISSGSQLSDSVEDHVPVQRRFLRCSLARCRIEFSPSIYPSHRHSVLLIASCDGAVAKVYQAIPSLGLVKKRRGSTATTDSAISTNISARRYNSSDKVLIDLHTPFSHLADQVLAPRRKRILDAKWVLHGRAVLVLLEDGEWGVWDIEAAGPSTPASATNLVRGQGNISGLQGGSITKFAIKGFVAAGNNPKQSTVTGGTKTSNTSLAPMTPHTRKTRAGNLFKGQDQASKRGPALVDSTQGIISVLVQANSNSGNRTNDEAVILNYSLTSVFISSLQSYWRAEGNRGSFDGGTSSRPILLPQPQTSNEELRNIHIMPQDPEHATSHMFVTNKLAHNFLVATASRLILFVAPLTEPTPPSQTSSLPMRLLADSSTSQDQMLLDSGELDVDGMDRILDGMASSGTALGASTQLSSNNFGRKSVGFQLDNDDQDVDMTTPTASKGAKSKLFIDKNSSIRQDGGRRLFT